MLTEDTRETYTAASPVKLLPAGEFCPLCGGEGGCVMNKDRISLRACGLPGMMTWHGEVLLAWAWPDEATYEAFYTEGGAFHTDEARAVGKPAYGEQASYDEHCIAALGRLQHLDCFTDDNGKTMLDVGAADGAFVHMAREWPESLCLAQGIDPNPYSERVDKGGWADVTGEWDVITLHDVLEHLTRPLECLVHLASCLSENGLIVVETPEWDGPDQRRAGMEWRHIKPRQHVCLYSRGAAEELFDRAGLETICFYRPLRGEIGKMAHYLQRKQ